MDHDLPYRYMGKADPPQNDQVYKNADRLAKMIDLYHTHGLSPNQCSSILVQTIDAPLPLVWSMVRSFSTPQAYKGFVKSCTMLAGDGAVGSVREIMVVSGLPATKSTEQLDRLDDDLHVMVFSIIGGDHRLENYQSTTTVHQGGEDQEEAGGKTVVIESYVVDVPASSSSEDTCLFANTIIGCNLRSLAMSAEKIAYENMILLVEILPFSWNIMKRQL
ncbi:hypothetical protein F0562_013906 [Nyssa sinensis]|uniref:Abscisic acid receptor PYL12 n=1 Tax=Nyssa sinensis TaxID=561372 RepID=A0A5J4ZNV3_9ASTE|nr:hypothetical protein F0562_013906 [Nyssa sinensis]